ncbi:MAG: four helix bundle protein [Bacteroidota bacterium]
MARFEKFEDLKIWLLAREICNDIFELFETTPIGKEYALRNQMNRCSGSIMDNIAEGFERNGNREFIQYLSISKASCGELRSQLHRALDRKYIDEEVSEGLLEKLILESRQISSFITCLTNFDYRGTKFIKPWALNFKL